MPPPAYVALELYLNQTRRSLRQLAAECVQRGVRASVATLKRWSARYDWKGYTAEHDRAALEQNIALTVDFRLQAMQAHFKLIASAKRRYYWILDPSNPNLTPAQRRRATRVTVSDYVRLFKIEAELYKHLKRFAAKRSADPEKPTASYTPQELEAMMRALAEVRHGLPPMRQDRADQRNLQPRTQTKNYAS